MSLIRSNSIPVFLAEPPQRERRVGADPEEGRAGRVELVETILEGDHLVGARRGERAGEESQYDWTVADVVGEVERFVVARADCRGERGCSVSGCGHRCRLCGAD